MAGTQPELRRGRIVWAVVRDRNGISKHRPVVIVTPTAEISDTVTVVAVTTTFSNPTPEDCIELPWHPAGRVSTRLRKRSAAVVSWLAEIDVEDVLELHGNVPVRLMNEILRRLDLTP